MLVEGEPILRLSWSCLECCILNKHSCRYFDGLNRLHDPSLRAGAIPSETAEGLVFEDLICKGGAVFVFNGWV